MTHRILIVDDDDDIRFEVSCAVRDLGYDALSCSSASEALRELDAADVDVLLTDFRMPSIDGIELCTTVARNYGIPVILMTAFGEMQLAIDAMRADAFDFMSKPFKLEQLADVIERALAERGGKKSIRKLELDDVAQDFSAIRGSSSRIRDLIRNLRHVARSDANVLVTGESGTGKDVVARALHENGPRRHGPFVAVNCAALPGSVLESELFGHVRGAFTGATTSHRGLFANANGGTLFLDEVASMPLELQPALLRALQERAVRPVGATREEPFDARIVAATNEDVRSAVQAGAFREDLLFRLDVLHVHAPPLRERGDDAVELARYFVSVHGDRLGRPHLTLSDGAIDAIRAYSWPGNVRELENGIEAAVALARRDRVDATDLSAAIRSGTKRTPEKPSASLDHLQMKHFERVLRAVGGNVARAARVLGIDRGTLYRRMKEFGAPAKNR